MSTVVHGSHNLRHSLVVSGRPGLGAPSLPHPAVDRHVRPYPQDRPLCARTVKNCLCPRYCLLRWEWLIDHIWSACCTCVCTPIEGETQIMWYTLCTHRHTVNDLRMYVCTYVHKYSGTSPLQISEVWKPL